MSATATNDHNPKAAGQMAKKLLFFDMDGVIVDFAVVRSRGP